MTCRSDIRSMMIEYLAFNLASVVSRHMLGAATDEELRKAVDALLNVPDVKTDDLASATQKGPTDDN